MLNIGTKGAATIETGTSCDVRVWSGACDRGPDHDTPEKYLCQYCETLTGLDHEVRHDIFPHVSGDYNRLM